MRMRFFNRVGLAGIWIALSAAVLAGPAESLFQGAWDWHLPPRHFGKLSMEERVAYSRAEDLIAKGQYEAAALEFEKFLTAYPQTAAYAHALLLEGYSLHLGRLRNKAIDRYKEIIEIFGDKPEAAAPATFLKGMALIENGNDEQGYAVLQELADNDAYLQSPVADLALIRLADRYLALEDGKKAERCWLRVMEAFQNSLDARPEASSLSARQKLTDLYIRQARASDIEDLAARFPQAGRKPPDIANSVFDRGMAIFDSLSPQARKSLFNWMRDQRGAYDAENRTADWINRLLILGAKTGLREEWGGIVRQAIDYFKSRPDAASSGAAATWIIARLCEGNALNFKSPVEWKAFGDVLTAHYAKFDAVGQMTLAMAVLAGFPGNVAEGTDADGVWNAAIVRARDLYLKMMNPEKEKGLAGLVDRLRNARRFDRALELAQRIERVPLALWKRIEVLGAQDKFADQAAACEELEKMDDKELSLRALRCRAGLYKDRLGKYEEAVKLYAMINEPPGTIWATVDCYQRWRKWDKAIAALSEIEGFFERDAPRAGLQKAYVWEQAGDKAKTVAALRTVLKKYPKDAVSSTAHQMLERYGVATGGGVIDED